MGTRPWEWQYLRNMKGEYILYLDIVSNLKFASFESSGLFM